MADERIEDINGGVGIAALAAGDIFVALDASDTAEDLQGTTKNVLASVILTYIQAGTATTDLNDVTGVTGTGGTLVLQASPTFTGVVAGPEWTFNGATGANKTTIPTNLADAWSILDSAGDLIVIDTTTGTQAITITPAVTATLASPVLNGTLSGTAFLDEDDMSSDSNTQTATQQSIKAYTDSSTMESKQYALLVG